MKYPQRGFSILEVMIALGLLGLGVYFIASLMKSGAAGQKTLLAQDDARVLTENISSLMRDPEACRQTFSGLDPSIANPVTVIKDRGGVAQYEAGKAYGNRGIAFSSAVLGGPSIDPKSQIKQWTPMPPPPATASGGTAFVQINWAQTGSGNSGPQVLARYILIYVTGLDANRKITTCVAAAGGQTGARTDCPSGFVLIGELGTNEAFCIDGAPRVADLGSAFSVCAHLTPAAHFCSVPEWQSACNSGRVPNMNGWELTPAFSNYGDNNTNNYPLQACNSMGLYGSGALPYRCCLR